MTVERVLGAGGRGQMYLGAATPVADPGADRQPPAPAADVASVIVEVAPDGILIVDPEGLISFANPAAAAIFGYPHRVMPGLPVEALVPDCLRETHVRYRTAFEQAPGHRPMAAGQDLLARRRDGREVPVEISLSPVSLAGRPATIVVVRPVEDLRRVEAELRRHLLVEEDERIATELNDRIVKRLFLAGMKIQSVIQLTDSPVTQQLHETVDQLDAAIREIRQTIFCGSPAAVEEDVATTT